MDYDLTCFLEVFAGLEAAIVDMLILNDGNRMDVARKIAVNLNLDSSMANMLYECLCNNEVQQHLLEKVESNGI